MVYRRNDNGFGLSSFVPEFYTPVTDIPYRGDFTFHNTLFHTVRDSVSRLAWVQSVEVQGHCPTETVDCVNIANSVKAPSMILISVGPYKPSV